MRQERRACHWVPRYTASHSGLSARATMTDAQDNAHDASALEARIAELEATLARMSSEVEHLQDSEALFRTLVQGAFEGLVVSVHGKIIEANDVFASMSGYSREELVGMTVADFVTRETAIEIMDRIRRGDETVYEIVAIRKDGSQIPVEILGREVTFRGQPARIAAFRDISERKRAEAEKRELEERMLAAEKLETIGMLAGGVAHDFNNLLLVIMGHAELALSTPGQGAAREHLDQIRMAAQRASELTKQMLTYAGRTSTRASALDLSDLVRNMTELLRVTIAANARLQLEMADALPALEGDATQLRQVVMNLISNASDALGDQVGEIRLRTGVCELDAARLEGACLDATAHTGEHVFLECEDTGRGMDAATQARMFDPFFSTKFAGRGLGLASVIGIIRAHAGAIVVKSAMGHGTRVTIYLPASTRQTVHTETPRPPPSHVTISGRVLVVDDERMIRVLTADMLRGSGLDVLTAADGEEAVRVFAEHVGSIDVVVLDLTMPRMTGIQTLRALRALDAKLPVILVSGFHEADVNTDESTSFLTKPFELNTLLDEIRARLEARRPG
jgi:two-component system cell cycle sensor histidine kinase/response regulator CckA